MARPKAKQPAIEIVNAGASGTAREAASEIFGALALILWFALFTYDPADPDSAMQQRMPRCATESVASGTDLPTFCLISSAGPHICLRLRSSIVSRLDAVSGTKDADQTSSTSACALPAFSRRWLAARPVDPAFASAGFFDIRPVHQLKSWATAWRMLMKLLGASGAVVLRVGCGHLGLGISWINVMDRIGQWTLLGLQKPQDPDR